MTKGDADFLKISIIQVRQYRDVDAVVGKSRRVSLKANVRQPLCNRLHCGNTRGPLGLRK
jgi:hypothetical protein